jgi:hypothetical protein
MKESDSPLNPNSESFPFALLSQMLLLPASLALVNQLLIFSLLVALAQLLVRAAANFLS